MWVSANSHWKPQTFQAIWVIKLQIIILQDFWNILDLGHYFASELLKTPLPIHLNLSLQSLHIPKAAERHVAFMYVRIDDCLSVQAQESFCHAVVLTFIENCTGFGCCFVLLKSGDCRVLHYPRMRNWDGAITGEVFRNCSWCMRGWWHEGWLDEWFFWCLSQRSVDYFNLHWTGLFSLLMHFPGFLRFGMTGEAKFRQALMSGKYILVRYHFLSQLVPYILSWFHHCSVLTAPNRSKIVCLIWCLGWLIGSLCKMALPRSDFIVLIEKE